MTYKTLGARVKHARKVRGITAARALDRKAGLKPGHVWQIENGAKPRLELETATKLADALDVSLDWLVNGEGDGPKKDSLPPSNAA